jgi:UDP-N-acetylglucosamine 4,6-dehydratase
MITDSDSYNTVDRGEYYAILPQGGNYTIDDYCKEFNAVRVRPGYAYNSGSNPDFLTVEQLRELIGRHVEHPGIPG